MFALLAVYGFLFLIVAAIPFCVGITLQIIMTIVSDKKWMLFIPAGLELIGVICSLIWLGEMIPVSSIIVYWVIVFISLWITWLIVVKLREKLRKIARKTG